MTSGSCLFHRFRILRVLTWLSLIVRFHRGNAQPARSRKFHTGRRAAMNRSGVFVAREAKDYLDDADFAFGVARFLAKERAESVIDIGSGSGAIARIVAQETGARVLGVDGNPLTTSDASLDGDRLTFRQLPLDRLLPTDVGIHDWAISFAVAEHVPFESEHVFLANLQSASRVGVLLVWDNRESDGTGHINSRDEHEVLNLFTALGFLLDTEATRVLRAHATRRWYKLVLAFRHGGQMSEKLLVAQEDGKKSPWYAGVLRLRAIAHLALLEHQRACWPPQWARLKEKCCSINGLELHEDPVSCFGVGFSYHACCADMQVYNLF